MKKYKVEYSGGESRDGNGAVNYMLLVVDDETELYAEYILTDDDEEDAGYDMLREDIIEQAEEIGLDPDDLEFWYD